VFNLRAYGGDLGADVTWSWPDTTLKPLPYVFIDRLPTGRL